MKTERMHFWRVKHHVILNCTDVNGVEPPAPLESLVAIKGGSLEDIKAALRGDHLISPKITIIIETASFLGSGDVECYAQ